MVEKMKSIIIHVGPSKTGTTTLQNTLSAHRELLLMYGYFYPETIPASNEGHPSLAWDILRDTGRSMPIVSLAYVSWQQVLEQYEKSGADHLVISSEDFSDGSFGSQAFSRLKEILPGFVIHVVFAIRDPAEVIRSTWQHSVKWGYGAGEELLDLGTATTSVLTHFPRIKVVPMVDLIRDFLLPRSLSFFTVPRKQDGPTLLQRFGEACRFPSDLTQILMNEPARSTNASLSWDQTILFLECNRALSRVNVEPDEANYRLQARSFLVEAAQTRRGDKSHWQFSDEAQALIGAIRERIKFCIQSEHVSGDIGDLGASPLRSVDLPANSANDEVAGELLAQLSLRLMTTLKHQGELQSYLGRVEAARDWWQDQAERLEANINSNSGVQNP